MPPHTARRRIGAALLTIGYSLLAVALLVIALCLATFAMLSCGYSESDMQLQRDRVELLQGMLDKCEVAARAGQAQAHACHLELRR